MTVAMPPNLQLAHLLSGLVAGLEAQHPGVAHRKIVAAVRAAHAAARVSLPDLSSYAAVVAHEAQNVIRGGGPLQG